MLDLIEAGEVERATVAMSRHLDEIESRLSLAHDQDDAVDLRALFGTIATG